MPDLLWLELDNYVIIKHAKLEFPTDGVYFITGDNQDDEECVANKTGKSVMLSSLIWIPYGETPNNITGDSILGVFEKNCRGAMGVKGDDGHIYKIVRHRKHHEFKNEAHIYRFNEETEDFEWLTEGKRASDVNDDILEIMRITRDQMLKTVFHSQGHYDKFTKKSNKRFLLMSGAERQDFLLFLKDLAWVDDAVKDANTSIKEIMKLKEQEEIKLADVRNKISFYEKEIVDETEVINEKSAEISCLDADIISLDEEISSASKSDIETLSQEKDEAEALYSSTLDSKELLRNELEELKEEYTNKAKPYRDERDSATTSINNSRAEVEEICEIKKCSKCKQEVGDEHKEDIKAESMLEIDRSTQRLDAAETELEKLRTEFAEKKSVISEKISEAENTLEQCKTTREKLNEEIEDLKSKDIDSLKQGLAAKKATLETIIKDKQAREKRLQELQENLDSFSEQKIKIEEEIYFYTDLIEYYKALSNMIGRKNLKSALLNDMMFEIQEIANDVLKEIDFGNMSIGIKGLEEEDFSDVEFLVDDKHAESKKLNYLSGREFAIVEFAIDVGIESIITENKIIDYTAKDEAKFEALDSKGLKILMDYYKRQRAKILLVSHRPELSNNFSNVITMIKKDGVSHAEQTFSENYIE